MGEPTTQKGRFLQITTALPFDTLLIAGFSGTERMSDLYRYEVALLADVDKARQVIEEQLIGEAVAISVDLGEEKTRFFHGIINRFQQGGRDDRFVHYRAEVVPFLWRLKATSNCRIFQDMTLPEVVKKVLNEQGVQIRDALHGTYTKVDYCVQYRESDFQFISRLMEEEGIFYFFEHSADSHVMVLGDHTGAYPACKEFDSFDFTEEDSAGDYEMVIDQWETSRQIRPGVLSYRDHNFQLFDKSLECFEFSAVTTGNNQGLEVYDYPGDYAKRFNKPDERLGEVQNEGANLLRLRMEDEETLGFVATGSGNAMTMASGHTFELKEHFLDAMNGRYVLTSVTHMARQTPVYISDEAVDGRYKVSFACAESTVIVRPGRKTPKPVIPGPQTARVMTRNDNEDIFVDKYGRVKVHFHWDRLGPYNDQCCCWLRVSQPWAGQQWGAMWIPRRDQDVIVDFLEGDPDRPIIVGRVYDNKHMPHYPLPEFDTVSYFKSNSTERTKRGAKGFNEVRFEDLKGKEQVFIHSQRRMDIRALASYYETNFGNREIVVGWEKDGQTGGDLNILVKGEENVHVKKAHYEQIEKKLHHSVKEEVLHEHQQSAAWMVTNKAELNAKEITIEGSQKIVLKVGPSFITLEPSGITIYGPQVKINSGGFASGVPAKDIDDPIDAAVSDDGSAGTLRRLRTATGGGPGRGHNRRHISGQHYRYPPRPGEDPRFATTRNRLNDTETGRHALEVMERYGTGVRYDTTDGYYYDPTTNTVTMNPNYPQGFQDTGMVHELNHDQTDHEGRAPNVNTESRADYIDHRLQEEAHGDALANQARREMEAEGHNMSDSPTQNQGAYDRGYNQGRADYLAAHPNATEDELDAAGRAAGEQAILDDYRNGRVTTSTPGNPTYPTYYGNEWDAAHPAPPPGGGGH